MFTKVTEISVTKGIAGGGEESRGRETRPQSVAARVAGI
jgi:hypothetical protein